MRYNYQILILIFLVLIVVRAVSIFIETRKSNAIVVVNKKSWRSFVSGGLFMIIGALWFRDDYIALKREVYFSSIIPVGIAYMGLGATHIIQGFWRDSICSSFILIDVKKYTWKRLSDYSWETSKEIEYKNERVSCLILKIELKDRFYHRWFEKMDKHITLHIRHSDKGRVKEMLSKYIG